MNGVSSKEVLMLPDLELMLNLQVIDYDLGELERSKEYLPDMMGNLTREIEEAKGLIDTAETTLEQEKVSQKTLELDVKTKEADLQRLQQQMMTIKTNREYDALVAEIDAIKAGISTNETALLQTMERIAKLEAEIPDLKGKYEQTEENNRKQLEVLQEKVDSIGSKVDEKMAERNGVVKQISRGSFSVYERVRRGKGGGAVVVTVKKRACSGCHAALTPRRVQEIRKSDRILTCDNCGRILYWDNDTSD